MRLVYEVTSELAAIIAGVALLLNLETAVETAGKVG